MEWLHQSHRVLLSKIKELVCSTVIVEKLNFSELRFPIARRVNSMCLAMYSLGTFLEPDSLELAEAAYNWGMGENNPMEHVRFVSKCGSYAVHMREPELAIQGGMLPSTFKEQYTSIICR